MGDQSKLMIVCEVCADNYPEGCGHYNRSNLRVAPDGRWMCESCFDDDPEFRGKTWNTMRLPSKRAAFEAIRTMFDG